jgi:hypothetical protein
MEKFIRELHGLTTRVNIVGRFRKLQTGQAFSILNPMVKIRCL